MIAFQDGVRLSTDGPLRVEEEAGQFYVLGEGITFPVDSREAGKALIDSIESRSVFLNMRVFKSAGARYRVNQTLSQIAEEMSAAPAEGSAHE